MKKIAMLAGGILAIFLVAGCKTQEPIRIRTRTERTERVIRRDIMDTGNASDAFKKSEADETVRTRTTTKERVIKRDIVVD